MSVNIKIRSATLADARTIADFNYSMAVETEHRCLNPKRLLRGVKSLLGDRSKGFYILAEVGGIVVGQLMITYEWSDWRCGNFWWVQSVYVTKEFRRAGVFKTLFRWIEKQARKDSSVCGLRLYAERSNKHARQAYERLGMKKTGYNLFEKEFVIQGDLNA